MGVTDKIPFLGGGDPYKDLVSGLVSVKDDADAVALLPYDDGTFFLKPADFDKDLIGGQGGYETPDGDKIVMDGDGQPVKDLFGVPMLLAVDPTEHAAAVEPIKALIAQKENIGEWIRVDKKSNIIEVGDALQKADGGDLQIDFGDTQVGEKKAELDQAAGPYDMVSYDMAMEKLAEEGEITKIYDIAPPAAPSVNGDGEIGIDEATHYAVDQSKAADLLPTQTSTTELNVALDKARMEEHEEGQRMSDMLTGIIIGGLTVGLTCIVIALMMYFLL